MLFPYLNVGWLMCVQQAPVEIRRLLTSHWLDNVISDLQFLLISSAFQSPASWTLPPPWRYRNPEFLPRWTFLQQWRRLLWGMCRMVSSSLCIWQWWDWDRSGTKWPASSALRDRTEWHPCRRRCIGTDSVSFLWNPRTRTAQSSQYNHV